MISSTNFAALDVFEGQPLAQSAYEIRFETTASEMLTEYGVANRLLLSEDVLLANVRRVQERNGLPPSRSLDGLDFSVEMETGTGKTYVYLRTIYELNARYGFKKFIIVVPSVAIREGVKKHIDMTREHFRALYGNAPQDAWIYDSAQVSRLRHFATSNQMQVLIINIDAFNKKDIAVIHKDNDRLSGHRPIEFIQAVNPIVIMDEPQNMETETAKAAIASLNPLCTLRYSATHRHVYNLLYTLDPVRAYDLKLVKRIEVHSVVERGNRQKITCGKAHFGELGVPYDWIKTAADVWKLFQKCGIVLRYVPPQAGLLRTGGLCGSDCPECSP